MSVVVADKPIADSEGKGGPFLGRVKRFSVEDYFRLMETGILQDGDPYELLDGWIVRKMTKGPAHDPTAWVVEDELRRLAPRKWHVRPAVAMKLAKSVPEPDVAVFSTPVAVIRSRLPEASEVALVVEVADATLNHDRTEKACLYAEAKIPEYWIVNLPERQTEVHTQPRSKGDKSRYAKIAVFKEGETVPFKLDGAELGRLNVSDFFKMPPG
ncbi:MAG TPA: Uma2 family endonuclease [Planctomycetia bacterium]|jgi:Uma2 family endonuclease|nr:Uma2 family endonuclease [Planctomycetia bacterium]